MATLRGSGLRITRIDSDGLAAGPPVTCRGSVTVTFPDGEVPPPGTHVDMVVTDVELWRGDRG